MGSFSAEALERGLKATLLSRTATETPILVDRLCAFVKSDGSDEKHEYMTDAPQMVEFKGSRMNTPLGGKGYTIANVVYDAAVLVSRDDLRRNRTGSYMKQINKLIGIVMAFPNKRLIELIIAGTSGLGYDENEFFDDTHPALRDEGGTQDNLLAGTGSTTAQIAADVAAASTALKGFKNTAGEPFHGDGYGSLAFLCHPTLEKGFREVLNSTLISNTTNVQAGMGELIVSPRLADTNDWYCFVTDPGSEPLIWQEEQGIETDVTAEGSELWTKHRQAEFGASASLGAGYGFWQSAVKTVNS